MKITWDKKAKAVYIYLTEEVKVDKTTKISEGIYIDFSGDMPIGIEILDIEEFPTNEQI